MAGEDTACLTRDFVQDKAFYILLDHKVSEIILQPCGRDCTLVIDERTCQTQVTDDEEESVAMCKEESDGRWSEIYKRINE